MLPRAGARDQTYPRSDLVLRQVRRRLVPFAFLCYVAAYIDRVNIGFADGHVVMFRMKDLADVKTGKSTFQVLWSPMDKEFQQKYLP